MTATKNFKPYKAQIDLLARRGMIFSDTKKAEQILAQVNYYRLSGYWFPFFDQKEQHFRKNLTFTKIVELYDYDREVRYCLFKALSEIEIAIRALIGYELGKQNPYGYLDAQHMGARAKQYKITNSDSPITYHQSWLKRFNTCKKSSKEAFVKHHIDFYNDKMPIWAAVEIMDWGLLSNLYGICDNYSRNSIATRCNLSAPQLESWLKSLNIARNLCAHHARMYNKVFTVKPKFPEGNNWKVLRDRSNKIFAIMAMTAYLSRTLGISDAKTFCELIEKFPGSKQAIEHTMGIPDNWKEYLVIAPYAQ